MIDQCYHVPTLNTAATCRPSLITRLASPARCVLHDRCRATELKGARCRKGCEQPATLRIEPGCRVGRHPAAREAVARVERFDVVIDGLAQRYEAGCVLSEPGEKSARFQFVDQVVGLVVTIR